MRAAVIQNKSLFDSGRIDPSYHLSESIKLKKQLLGSPYTLSTIGEKSEEVFLGNIFTRVFVKDTEHGIPYIAASDMTKASVSSGKFISKKQAKKLKRLMLDSGWILISCSGTLGNVVYTNDLFKNTFATHDLIRLIPDDKKMLSGFLYAYLASKYGYTLLTQSGFGGVVKHINSEHVANIPVPIFPESKQQEIHNLIVESANLRVEANQLLEEAVADIETKLPTIEENKIKELSLSQIRKNSLRMEATTNFREIENFYQKVSISCKISTINELSERVFTPNIFKRQRTDNISKGVPFLSGSDLNNFRPSFSSFLSKKMKNVDNYIIRNGWIAVQDAGTIGYVTLINGYLDGVSATNNLVRIIPNEENYNPYIFAFLNTKQGQTILKSQQFGSVQKHIDNNIIVNYRIPILDNYDEIKCMILKYNTKITEAVIKENQAISLVEKEIESWQQS